MTDTNLIPPFPSDFENWIAMATQLQGSKILRLDKIAEIWQGASYEKSDLLMGNPSDDEFSKNAILVVTSADHRSKDKGFVQKDLLKTKLTDNAGATAVKKRFLKNGDLLITAKGATGKVACYIDFKRLLDETDTNKGVVVTDSHIIIRIKKDFRRTFAKFFLQRLLMSEPYQQLFQSLTKNGKTRVLSLDEMASIQIPLLPIDKATTLDLLLNHEPKASADRIVEVLTQEQRSIEAIDCFSRLLDWNSISGVFGNDAFIDARVSFHDLMNNNCGAYLAEKKDSQNPFVLWLQHFQYAANYLEKILQSPRDAKMIVALQGWRTLIFEGKSSLVKARNTFFGYISQDYKPLREIIYKHCDELHKVLKKIAQDNEAEISLEVSKEIPLHPDTHEATTKKEDLAKRIWALLDFAKTSKIDGTQLYVIPFMLYLTKNSGLHESPETHQLNYLTASLSSFGSKSDIHHTVADWFRGVQGTLSNRVTEEIVEISRTFWKELDAASYMQLTNDFFDLVQKRNAKTFFEAPISKELMSFMVQSANITQSANIYIPYSPGHSFTDYLPKGSKASFQFINPRDADIFALHEVIKERHTAYHISDPVIDWNPNRSEIDVVFAAPPMSRKIIHPEYNDAEVHCIMESASILKNKNNDFGIFSKQNRALICVSPSFLLRKGHCQKARKKLIEQNAIEKIIYFPPGIIEGVAVAQALVILRPSKPSARPMVLVDASDCMVKPPKSRLPVLDVEKLKQVITADKHPKKRLLTAEELRENDYDLTPGRYLVEENEALPENHTHYHLRQIITKITDFPRSQAGDLGVPLNQRLLPATDSLEFVSFSNQDSVTFEDLQPPTGWRVASRDALILNSILSPKGLRTCLFKYSGTNVFLRPDMMAFEIKSEIVDPQWLQLALGSEFVTNQLKSLTLGSGIPRIRTELLLNLKLAVPNLPEQRLLVKYHKETLLKSQAKEMGLEDLIRSMRKEFLDDLRLKKHSISQITNDIKSAIAVILDELSKKGSISAEQIISPRRSINFSDYLQGMSQKCGALGGLIDKLTEENKHEPLAPLNLAEAMKQAVMEYKGENFELSFFLDSRSFVDPATRHSIKPIIRIGENDFQTLYRNIIDNAKRHAFKGNFKSASIRVSAELMHEEQMVELCFMNNGAHFPKDMDLERFILRGEKAGTSGNTGTGGYHIKSIMDHVGGRLDIATPPFDDYSTEIRLFFPISYEDTI